MPALMLASQQIALVAEPMATASQDQFWAAIGYVIVNALFAIMLGVAGLWAAHRVRQ